MKALIVTLLPSFIQRSFASCFDFTLPWLPWLPWLSWLPWLTWLPLLWALGGNNLNFSNPLGIQTSSCSSGNSPAICPHNCVALDAVFTTSSPWQGRRGSGSWEQGAGSIRTRRRNINDAIKSTFLFVALFVLPAFLSPAPAFLANKFPRN